MKDFKEYIFSTGEYLFHAVYGVSGVAQYILFGVHILKKMDTFFSCAKPIEPLLERNYGMIIMQFWKVWKGIKSKSSANSMGLCCDLDLIQSSAIWHVRYLKMLIAC